MNSMKKIIVPKNILTVNNKNEILYNHAIEITDGVITNILETKKLQSEKFDCEVENLPNLTLIPGFVQTHVHLCQTLFRGLAEDMELLDGCKKEYSLMKILITKIH